MVTFCRESRSFVANLSRASKERWMYSKKESDFQSPSNLIDSAEKPTLKAHVAPPRLNECPEYSAEFKPALHKAVDNLAEKTC